MISSKIGVANEDVTVPHVSAQSVLRSLKCMKADRTMHRVYESFMRIWLRAYASALPAAWTH